MSGQRTHLRFSTEILRHLGEELNPGPDRSILELVKNAYDADATHCTVTLQSGSERWGVTVSDDGVGMTPDEVRDGWLVIGRSRKRPSELTGRGRIPAGSKGLGRLAALRLGRYAAMATRPASALGREYLVSIDWEDFTQADIVEDVELLVEERATEEEPGTDISLSSIRTQIGRMAVKRLARSMVLLADPFGDTQGGFHPRLQAVEFRDLERLVERRYFDDADYHLEATLDAGRASARVRDWRGEVLFEAEHSEIAAHRDVYNAPPAQFDLWAFLLSQQHFSEKTISLKEVRDWLTEFGGVHVYLNGLKVEPYGGPGNDWLDLNLLRARDPQLRPSTNTSIGRLQVRDTSDDLVQKTDRSGFIENQPFDDLREFARDALEWMARRRIEERDRRRAVERKKSQTESEKSRDSVQAAIEALPENERREVGSAFRDYDRKRTREVENLREEVQLYRTLSTAGITAATFAHESRGNPLKVIDQATRAIERRVVAHFGEEAFASDFNRPIELIRRAWHSLSVLSSATLRLLDHEKRRIGRVNLNQVIADMIDTYAPFLEGRDVQVQLRLSPGEPYTRGSEAAFETVVSNLLNNSLVAFEDASSSDRHIRITTSVDAGEWRMVHEDSGPGIQEITVKDVWLPGQTTRQNGTGLGLTIVKDTIADLGGSVAATEAGELGGAVFEVSVPIIGA